MGLSCSKAALAYVTFDCIIAKYGYTVCKDAQEFSLQNWGVRGRPLSVSFYVQILWDINIHSTPSSIIARLEM